ncbi:NPC intracellular cholesterol transporter 2 homolog a isoform X2 [Cephus cinctus]|nr:NPC intracellular cholesterol transporter 2 homolog a isoform X2 [Cephus cinctus]
MYTKILVVLLCIFALNNATFIDCGSKLGNFTQVSVTNCTETASTCNLRRGSNATIDIAFTIDRDISNVNTVVHGILMDIPVPFPIPNADACANSDSGITCPLQTGKLYNYKATLPIYKKYPKVSVTVKWELQDENKNDIICIFIPAKLV